MKRIATGMVLFTLLLVLGLAQSAFALDITPADKFAQGNETSNNDVVAAAGVACGCTLNSQYKQDVGGGESGALASSYSATFANSPGDPSEFTLTYTGGAVAAPTSWLLVKDGNQTPAWYLFNLTALGWNGTAVVHGTAFWPAEGAISHVELFSSGQQIPEPVSLILLGSGVLALGLIRRKYRQ